MGVESPHADVTDPTPPADTNQTNLVLHQNKLERFSNLCRLIIINLPLSCVFFDQKVPPTVKPKKNNSLSLLIAKIVKERNENY